MLYNVILCYFFSLSVSAHREFISVPWSADAVLSSRVYFSSCDNQDIHGLQEGDTFRICQAGYPDRKLIYDHVLEWVVKGKWQPIPFEWNQKMGDLIGN
jgi:hypothetical protein